MIDIQLMADERIDQLYSQDVKIIQSSSVFAFSLDAVLLAMFAKGSKSSKNLTVDMCAGNGAVGLFFAQKTNGKIIEIEIQPRLADMAKRSVSLNQFENKIQVLNIDLANSLNYIQHDSVDAILCNPPYFSDLPTSVKNPNEYLAIARHEIKTNLEMVCKTSNQLLKTNGKLYMVHRPDRLIDIMETMKTFKLAPKNIQFVHPKNGKEANMVLIEAIKNGSTNGLKVLQPLTVYDENGQYTKKIHEALYGTQK